MMNPNIDNSQYDQYFFLKDHHQRRTSNSPNPKYKSTNHEPIIRMILLEHGQNGANSHNTHNDIPNSNGKVPNDDIGIFK